jgi:hypothetical protein
MSEHPTLTHSLSTWQQLKTKLLVKIPPKEKRSSLFSKKKIKKGFQFKLFGGLHVDAQKERDKWEGGGTEGRGRVDFFETNASMSNCIISHTYLL